MLAVIACRDYIYGELVEEMEHRHLADTEGWVEAERQVVAAAATAWATAHGYDSVVTAEDVERVEGAAVGHIDYASKLALYVAEMVVPHR